MAKFPAEVLAFHKAMKRLVAVVDVTTGLKNLAEFTPDTYIMPGEFGDLPHALLRRTKGGLKNEVWVNTEFELAQNDAGWLTLEFIAWWIRDLSRSKELVQLRPMALPPVAYDVQLGRTLKFIIDQFVICPGGKTSAVLAMVKDRAESLNRSIDDYGNVLGDLVRKPKRRKKNRKTR